MIAGHLGTQAIRTAMPGKLPIGWSRAASLLVLAGWLLVGSQARACSIPVFRYALARWQPAPYELHLFHRDPLPASAKALLAKFEKPARPMNLDVHVVNLSGDVAPEA